MSIENKLTKEELADLRKQLFDEIKPQLVQDLKNEELKEREILQQKKDEEDAARKAYVDKMKLSPHPWVEVVGATQTEAGMRVELDWNDAHVDYLRKGGVTGTDDEQVVHKWVTLLLRDMADDLDPAKQNQTEFA